MRVAFVGYDAFYSCLAALAENCTVLRIFTFPTDNVYEFNHRVIAYARTHRIPWTDQPITSLDLDALAAERCDFLFCSGYVYRIPNHSTLRMVNLHPSPLPIGRGPWPMPITILHGDTESAVTVHKIVRELDAGDILLQHRFPIAEDETLESLMEKISTHSAEAVHVLTEQFDPLYENAVPQEKGEYWPEPTDGERTVRETMSPEQADRILRAFYGYGCFYRGETILRGRLVSHRPETTYRRFQNMYIKIEDSLGLEKI
ncbi:MAG: hypothetical protein IJY12_00120 [Clostridia bacterium]|nr:hypothetical protein [Clostridia bacterium]